MIGKMTRFSRSGGLAVFAMALAIAESAQAKPHAMRDGETRQFNMSNIEMIGGMNGLLNKKLGGELMVTGGTIKRMTPDISLVCGYYTNIRDPQASIAPSAIVIDLPSSQTITVAPITHTQLEAKGCFPGQRAQAARMERQINSMLARAK